MDRSGKGGSAAWQGRREGGHLLDLGVVAGQSSEERGNAAHREDVEGDGLEDVGALALDGDSNGLPVGALLQGCPVDLQDKKGSREGGRAKEGEEVRRGTEEGVKDFVCMRVGRGGGGGARMGTLLLEEEAIEKVEGRRKNGRRRRKWHEAPEGGRGARRG